MKQTIGEKLNKFDESNETVKDFNQIFGRKLMRFKPEYKVNVIDRLTDTLLLLDINGESIRIDIRPTVPTKWQKFVYQTTDLTNGYVFDLHTIEEVAECLDIPFNVAQNMFRSKSKKHPHKRFVVEQKSLGGQFRQG